MLERHIERVFRYLNVDFVFDVGANVGQYGRMLRKQVGYKGQIVSFEPNPEPRGVLSKLASEDPNWHVEPIAVGAEPGVSEFYVYDQSEWGSLRRIGNSKYIPIGHL